MRKPNWETVKWPLAVATGAGVIATGVYFANREALKAVAEQEVQSVIDRTAREAAANVIKQGNIEPDPFAGYPRAIVGRLTLSDGAKVTVWLYENKDGKPITDTTYELWLDRFQKGRRIIDQLHYEPEFAAADHHWEATKIVNGKIVEDTTNQPEGKRLDLAHSISGDIREELNLAAEDSTLS